MKRWYVLLTGISILGNLVAGLPAYAQDGDCSRTPPTHFQFGDRVRVIRHPERAVTMIILFLKTGPSWSAGRVDELMSDDEVTIQSDAPICDAGYEWWFVMTDDERTGWTVSAVEMGNTMFEVELELVDLPSGNSSGTASNNAQPVSATSGNRVRTLFQTDFATRDTHWGNVASENYWVGYYGTEYRIEVGNEWNDLWQMSDHEALNTLTEFTASVKILPMDIYGAAGLVIGGTMDMDVHYEYLFRPAEHSYQLRYYDGQRWLDLTSWTHSPLIEAYPESNSIKLTAREDSIALYANGELLEVVEPAGPVAGRVGLKVSRFLNTETAELRGRFSTSTTSWSRSRSLSRRAPRARNAGPASPAG